MLIRNISLAVVVITMGAYAATLGDIRLAQAVKNRDKDAARTLIGQKVNVNAVDAEDATPVLWAAHWNDIETVKLLIAAGANVKIANSFGVTPLAEAAGLGDVPLMSVLLDAGADVNATLGSGDTPLMLASRTGNIAAVKMLVEHHANVNSKDAYRGLTALMWAVAENHKEVVTALLAAGADVNARSITYAPTGRGRGGAQAAPKGGLTPILMAARQGAIESGRILIDAGANMAATEPEIGLTPLAIAVYNDHYDFAAMMVEKGANVNDGSMYVAVEMRNLPEYGNRPRPKPDKLDEMSFIKLLLDKGANPDLPLTTRQNQLPNRESTGTVAVPIGATPFWRAARSSDLPLMKMLLERGANPKIPLTDKQSALSAAATGREQVTFQAGIEHIAEADTMEAIKLLMSKGLDINAASDRGETALHGAALNGNNKVVQFLLANGANPDVKNKAGKTPEDMAMTIINTNGGEVHPPPAALIRQWISTHGAKTSAQAR